MPALTARRALQIGWGGAVNLLARRPLAVSLEITHSCNCNCSHCDKGGAIPQERLAPPARFAQIVRELKPLVAQVSGGEPLLRADVYEIIERIHVPGRLPHIVFVTNAALLTPEIYDRLKAVGVDEFSISLDFPDERHDRNRGIPGLYRHLDGLIPRLAARGNGDITLISVIRRQNLADLPSLAEHAIRWDVAINFSAYTPLRTGDPSIIPAPDDLPLLRTQLDGLLEFGRRTGRVFTMPSSFASYRRFFEAGGNLPDCRAGVRSLVVNPDGRLAPCAMQPHSFETRAELLREFTATNTCGGCCVSMLANTEKSLAAFVRDGCESLRRMRLRRDGGRRGGKETAAGRADGGRTDGGRSDGEARRGLG